MRLPSTQASRPPSTTSSAPVTNEASSEARNAAAAATSSGSPDAADRMERGRAPPGGLRIGVALEVDAHLLGLDEPGRDAVHAHASRE